LNIANAPVLQSTGAVSKYIYDGIAVTCTPYDGVYSASNNNSMQRVLVTLQFDEQESDPILQICVCNNGALAIFNYASMVFYFDPAKMPKGLTGVNIYAWQKEWRIDGVEQGNGWKQVDDFNEYNLIGTIDMNTGWASGSYSAGAGLVTIDSVASVWANTSTIAFTQALT